MGTNDTTAEPKIDDATREDATLELHIRQVEDRALPARQVLLQQTQGGEPAAPRPVFVP